MGNAMKRVGLFLSCNVLASVFLFACSKSTTDVPQENNITTSDNTQYLEDLPLIKSSSNTKIDLDDPKQVWCEEMMEKPNGDWIDEDFIRFSQECLYNEIN